MYMIKGALSLASYGLVLYAFYKGRCLFSRRSIIAAMVAIPVGLSAAYLLDIGEATVMVTTILSVFIAVLFIDGNFIDRILAFFLAYSMEPFLKCIVEFAVNIAMGRSTLSLDLDTDMISEIVTLALMIIVVLIRQHRGGTLAISRPLTICITISSLFFTFAVVAVEKLIGGSNESVAALLVIGLIMTASFGFGLILVDSSRRKIRYEQALLRQYMESNKTYLAALQVRDRENRRYRHDVSHHLEVITRLAEEGENLKLADYLGQCRVHTENETDSVFHSGNKIADAIIMEKSLTAAERGVTLVCRGELCEPYFVPDYDLCTILANLLSNAIEYMADNGGGTVTVTFVTKACNGLIQVKNPIADSVDVDKCILTTGKADKDVHGYGIGNVRQAVSRNRGDLYMERIGSDFVAEVLLDKRNIET